MASEKDLLVVFGLVFCILLVGMNLALPDEEKK